MKGMKRRQVVLATHNRGKIGELRQLLAGLPLEVKSIEDFPGLPELVETGATFRENARSKALTVHQYTNLPSIADDSGLEVDFLQGAPGVFSARYAGSGASDAENNLRLLEDLAGVPEEDRSARFRCVICFVFPGGHCEYTEGTCEGRIGFGPRGNKGFGYDPLFLVGPDFQRTMAELELEEKNTISHRSRAYRQLQPLLERLLV